MVGKTCKEKSEERKKIVVVVQGRSMEGHRLWVKHKQDWVESLYFYYHRLLYCLDKMLATMVLSQQSGLVKNH